MFGMMPGAKASDRQSATALSTVKVLRTSDLEVSKQFPHPKHCNPSCKDPSEKRNNACLAVTISCFKSLGS